MARTPKNNAAAQELGRRLSALHETYKKRHGPTSYDRIAREIEFQFHVVMSHEHVRKYHRGENDPYAMNPIEIAALAAFYGVAPSKLGKDVSAIIKTARDVLACSTGWFHHVAA